MKLGNKTLLRIYAKHDPYWKTDHVQEVIDDMLELGAPIIKVIEYRGDYYAVEGSHRLYSAFLLGLVPVLDILEQQWWADNEEFWDMVKNRLPHYTWET